MGRHTHAAPAAPGRRSPWRIAVAGGLVVTFLATLVGLFLLWPRDDASEHVTAQFTRTYALNQPLVSASVISTDDQLCDSPATGKAFDEPPTLPAVEEKAGCSRFLLRIGEGKNAGKLTQLVYWGVSGDPDLHVGDALVLSESADGTYSFADFERDKSMWVWGAVVAVAVIVVAAWHGLRALIGLGYSIGFVFLFLLPALMEGKPALAAALACCSIIMFGAIPLVHGINWKSASALGGTLLALGCAGVFGQLAISSTALSGMSNEENLKLALYIPSVSIVGVLMCGFVVGTLGALNDVSIGQASTVNELALANPQASPWQLFTSAMKVGRDHLASMVYTIVLSYTGAVLPLLILISAASRPAGQILTSDLVATELLRSLVGVLTLALCIPLTTILAALTVPEPLKAAA